MPALAARLGDEYPLVRYFAQHALGRVLGEEPPIDLNQDAATIATQADAWLRAHGANSATPPAP